MMVLMMMIMIMVVVGPLKYTLFQVLTSSLI